MFSDRYASPDLGIVGRDDSRRAVPAREPGTLHIGDVAVIAIVEDVLAEVPDVSVVALGVEVEGDLLHAPFEIADELGDDALHRLPVPLGDSGLGKEGDLDPQRFAVDLAEHDRRGHLGDGVERIGDLGWVRE